MSDSESFDSEKDAISSEICSELRELRDDDTSYETIDEQFTLDIEEILKHVHGECSCPNSDESPIPPKEDRAWREEHVLDILYNRYNLLKEPSNILGCNTETVRTHLDEHNISSLGSQRTSSPRVNKYLEKANNDS